MLKRLKDLGSEQVGRVANRLLANDRFVALVQTAVRAGSATRNGLESTARFALSTLNLPSRADVDRVGQKLDELEELLDELGRKVDGLGSGRPASAADPEQRAEG